MRCLLLFSLSFLPVFAQPVTVGAIGAVRATGDMSGMASSESKPYLVGPMFSLHLPRHFGFEADALYSRFGYTSSAGDLFGDLFITRARANSWEFPLLAHYRFATLGYAPRHTSGTFEETGYTADYYTGLRSPVRFTGTSSYETAHALVVGAGHEFAFGALRVAPQVRYLRWKNPVYSFAGSQGYTFQTPQNELQFLVGIGWGGPHAVH